MKNVIDCFFKNTENHTKMQLSWVILIIKSGVDLLNQPMVGEETVGTPHHAIKHRVKLIP